MKDILLDPHNPDFAALWTAINAVAATISMIALIVTIIVTRKGLKESLDGFKKTFEISHYSELDRTYFELLRVALDKPYLNNPAALTVEQQPEYDIYAYMMWNFLEAIQDRCKGDKFLEATWLPVFEAEKNLHIEWFKNPDNNIKFKEDFQLIVLPNTDSG